MTIKGKFCDFLFSTPRVHLKTTYFVKTENFFLKVYRKKVKS